MSSPTHPLTAARSPTKKGASDGAVQQEEPAEDAGAQEAKLVGTSSNVATAKSFNWASIKVCFWWTSGFALDCSSHLTDFG